jgi:hypothetical protein
MIEVVEALIKFLRNRLIVAEVGYDLQRVYPDMPRSDLSDTSYPRIHILPVAAVATDAELGTYAQNQTYQFQVNIYTRPKIIVTIGADKFEGAKLNKRILSDCMEAFRKYQNDPELVNAGLYDYKVNQVLANFPEDDVTHTQQVAFEVQFTRTVL